MEGPPDPIRGKPAPESRERGDWAVTWPDCLGDPYELAITITEMERDIEELKKRLERLERLLLAKER